MHQDILWLLKQQTQMLQSVVDPQAHLLLQSIEKSILAPSYTSQHSTRHQGLHPTTAGDSKDSPSFTYSDLCKTERNGLKKTWVSLLLLKDCLPVIYFISSIHVYCLYFNCMPLFCLHLLCNKVLFFEKKSIFTSQLGCSVPSATQSGHYLNCSEHKTHRFNTV